MQNQEAVELIVNNIFGLFDKYGHDEYGESITQLEHAVQSAQLAAGEGYEDEVILAALFHDIGHLAVNEQESKSFMGNYGAMSHDKIGGDYLRHQGFSERMAQLVENHVQAKRYLTFKEADYYGKLSEASKKTLEYQGGRMTAREAADFEQNALFKLSLRMRHWDEEAKEIGMPTPDLKMYQDKCRQYLLRNSA
ncbi:HD domain-containing protein [Catalinimonas niigatensis]|uniref:HD domain-containing protein n=1 Tax=Catalinimonas niigatensis TaxID=1397264 RepID=UPI0026658456|nr:HD domain-containing protein [Catalinimonas niigatensis]WPP48809.1 HD domain-containing protein [Catalinimonas niigatensis]